MDLVDLLLVAAALAGLLLAASVEDLHSKIIACKLYSEKREDVSNNWHILLIVSYRILLVIIGAVVIIIIRGWLPAILLVGGVHPFNNIWCKGVVAIEVGVGIMHYCAFGARWSNLQQLNIENSIREGGITVVCLFL